MKNKVKILLVLVCLVILAIIFDSWFALFQFGPNRFSKDEQFGIAELVVQDGKVIFLRTQGYSDRKNLIPISENTNFNLASNSKQFTAMTAFLLKRADLIHPEDPITKYIPELPKIYDQVRIENLIHHTSGLDDYMSICMGFKHKHNSDVIAYLSEHPKLEFQPGSKQKYSNTGYVILSEVLSRASKTSFSELISKHIFNPLEMKDSRLLTEDNRSEIPFRAIGYRGWPFSSWEADVSICDPISGDGGVYTSLNDYKKWAIAISDGKLVSARELDELFAPGKLTDGSSVAYGYGWNVEEGDHGRLIYHSGAWLGNRSSVLFYQKKKLWSIVFSNSAKITTWKRAEENALKFLN